MELDSMAFFSSLLKIERLENRKIDFRSLTMNLIFQYFNFILFQFHK